MSERTATFEKLVQVMDELREKCPWDRKQSIDSLRHLTIEEVYELGDAILEKNFDEIKKELGDILLHVIFYSKIASEQGKFTLTDVMQGITEKLVYRHPHIYGDVKVDNEEEVKKNWEKLKLKEGKKSVLSGVPVSLPALVKAMRIQEKARAAGFDWEYKDQVWMKVEEELRELTNAVKEKNASMIKAEFGDVLFALINYARFIDVNPEEALEYTNKKFTKRFQYLEDKISKASKDLQEMTLAEMGIYWNEAKAKGL